MINGVDYKVHVYKMLDHDEKAKMKRDYRKERRHLTPEYDGVEDEAPEDIPPEPRRPREPVYDVQNGGRRLQKILADLKEDGERVKSKSTLNDARLQHLRAAKFFSAIVASCGISSTAGLAVSIASLSLSATVALPVTVTVVVATVIAGGFGATCHQGIRFLEKRAVRINEQAQLIRETEKEIYNKYLMDEKVSATELSQLLDDVDRYYSRKEELSMRKTI